MMDGSASFLEACKGLVDDLLREEGSTHVLIGPEGSGKNEILAYIKSELLRHKYRIFHGSSYLNTELSKYHIFNQMLDDSLGESRSRDVEALMSGFESLLDNGNAARTVVIAEGLENASDESRDFFLFLSRLSRRHSFKLIGSFTTNTDASANYDPRFLQLLETETDLSTLHIEKMKLDDFQFILRDKGYNLPERFVNDLFRLVDGNVNTLKYSLKYYEDHGIINEKKEVDDVVYRFFPIPQGVEIHYDRVFSSLSETQVYVAEIMSLLHEEMSYRRLSRFTSMEETELLKVLSKLEKAGVVRENALKYDITNYRVKDFIVNRMSNTRRMEIYSILCESDLFGELPVQMQLDILLQREEYREVGKILTGLGNSILSEFTSLNSLIDFLTSYIEKVEGSEYDAIASQRRCDAMAQLGEVENASSCYESLVTKYPHLVSAKISLAKLTADRGLYDEALELIDNIGSNENVSESDIGLLYLAKGLILQRKREYGPSREITERAIAIFESTGNYSKKAEALNILGNLDLEVFSHEDAMKHYGEALSINRDLNMLSNAAKNLNNIAIVKSHMGAYTEAIDIFKQLIEDSYLTGEVVTRAFATYNLMETYYILGSIDKVRSYIPSAMKLVELANRSILKYRFYRFMSTVYLNELEVNNAYESSIKALNSVDNDKDGQPYRMAYALSEFYYELDTHERSDILPSLFSERFTEEEEFQPIFYAMGSIFFVFRGDPENAVRLAEICIESASSGRERYGYLMSYLHKALVYFYSNKIERLREFLKGCPETNTGAQKYDMLMDIVRLCVRADQIREDEFDSELSVISEVLREKVDLVTLYMETMVYLTRKRVYNNESGLKELVGMIPNDFMYAFNVFAENNLIS